MLGNHVTDKERANDTRWLQKRLTETDEYNAFNPNCSNRI
jgi:hypothetical protein